MIPNNKDLDGFAELFKQFADAFSEGAERAKLTTECKMRRFYRAEQATNKEDAVGAMFPDGTAVVQEYVTGNLHIYGDIKDLNKAEAEKYYFRWIDAERLR